MIKAKLVYLAAGVVLGSAGLAAAQGPAPIKQYTIEPGQAITFGGLTCTAYKGTAPTLDNLVCVRNDLKGLGVIISQAKVIVATQSPAGKVIVLWQKANR